MARRVIEGDWYPATVPENVLVDETAYVGSSYSFSRFRSELPVGLQVGRGASLCDGTVLDVGPGGLVHLGAYATVTAVRIVCDASIEIGDYALVSWDVLIMDTYRTALDPAERGRQAVGTAAVESMPKNSVPARPVRIGRNSWIGFGASVMPGVTIGEGAIIGACSVVVEDVPPFTLVAGNPARLIRRLDQGRTKPA
jgi:acetyltransferase-like isoleucine patch superfamily enzyme